MFYSDMMEHKNKAIRPELRLPGRGAGDNAAGRYEREKHEVFHDGWDIEEEPQLLKTDIRLERPRTALSWNKSPDLPFDRSINPYRGCEHGCIYCYARPSHAWLGMSAGLDFETRLIARPTITEPLAREIGRKNYKVAPIAMGTNTDPYQPCDAQYQITRNILTLLSNWNHPVVIITKGTLIERDIDILAPMAQKGLVRVGISVTTLDAALARKMEPRAPSPKRRLQMIARLAQAGIPVRVMVSPVILGLTDHELEQIITQAAHAGACAASWIMLRLPLEVAGLMQGWLQTHYPDRAAKVLARIREVHDGAEYDPEWHKRMRGRGLWPDLIARRFRIICEKTGLAGHLPPLNTDLFRRPCDEGGQLRLF